VIDWQTGKILCQPGPISLEAEERIFTLRNETKRLIHEAQEEIDARGCLCLADRQLDEARSRRDTFRAILASIDEALT